MGATRSEARLNHTSLSINLRMTDSMIHVHMYGDGTLVPGLVQACVKMRPGHRDRANYMSGRIMVNK